jgi:membrane protease subunit (stomatin/prohibitin family)
MSEQEAGQDARISDLEQAQQAQQPQAPEPNPDSSVFAQLSQLVQLHDSGALTDAEFTAAKARLLGSPGPG